MRTPFEHPVICLTLLFLCSCALYNNEASAQEIHVAIPDTFITETAPAFIPVRVSDVTSLGIVSFGFTISFDPAIIEIIEVVTGDGIAARFFITSNLALEGRVAVAAAGVESLEGMGALFYLHINFLQDGSTEMNFDSASFGETSIEVTVQNGRLSNVDPTGINHPGEKPAQLALTGNYPNPFSTTSKITMDLPEAAQVSVNVYNLTGQLEVSYPPRPIPAGKNQSVIIKASSLAAGAYYYRVIARSGDNVRYGSGALLIIH